MRRLHLVCAALIMATLWGASLTVCVWFSPGLGCGWLVCDDTLSMSELGRPSPWSFGEARGGP